MGLNKPVRRAARAPGQSALHSSVVFGGAGSGPHVVVRLSGNFITTLVSHHSLASGEASSSPRCDCIDDVIFGGR